MDWPIFCSLRLVWLTNWLMRVWTFKWAWCQKGNIKSGALIDLCWKEGTEGIKVIRLVLLKRDSKVRPEHWEAISLILNIFYGLNFTWQVYANPSHNVVIVVLLHSRSVTMQYPRRLVMHFRKLCCCSCQKYNSDSIDVIWGANYVILPSEFPLAVARPSKKLGLIHIEVLKDDKSQIVLMLKKWPYNQSPWVNSELCSFVPYLYESGFTSIMSHLCNWAARVYCVTSWRRWTNIDWYN